MHRRKAHSFGDKIIPLETVLYFHGNLTDRKQMVKRQLRPSNVLTPSLFFPSDQNEWRRRLKSKTLALLERRFLTLLDRSRQRKEDVGRRRISVGAAAKT